MLKRLWAWVAARFGYVKSAPGDWMDKPKSGGVAAAMASPTDYEPDAEFEDIATRSVPHPVVALHESVKAGKASIVEAHLLEARWDGEGRMLKEPNDKLREALAMKADEKPYRVSVVRGVDAVKAMVEAGGAAIEAQGKRWSERLTQMREAALREDDTFDFDATLGNYDPNQYTEYTPIMGGPHFKQLYLYDYLTQHARAFEAWNHNPIAKRIINIIVQYALGRGYKAVATKNDEKKQKVWDDFERKHDIKRKVTRFWGRELLIYGELMVDKLLWLSIDPSTVWDIITDPDNIEDVYYYYQCYPTAYTQFTGKQVPGVPGAADQKPIEFIIRQLPWDRVLHVKLNVVSNEKRGRSILFPVLGWVKRVKDLYNAQVIGAWLRASFIWDDTIDGSAADVSAHLAQYSSMPTPGSIFAHNKAVERKALSPEQAKGSGGSQMTTAAEIMAFIATSIGIPKEHFNIAASGGGSRATALTAAEPFTKVVEELQGEMEDLLNRIAEVAFKQAGMDYTPGDIEFVFPSVTKDTTTEAIQNILAAESAGYISKPTAGNMVAAELNITNYDFEDEQEKSQKLIDEGKAQTMTGVMPPSSRLPKMPPPGAPAEPEVGGSDIHGQGKVDLVKSQKTL